MVESPAFDRARIIEVLDRQGVDYLIVGGVGAQLHGATRPTADFDSLPSTTEENLGRLAAALRELNAFLRVGGLSDADARALPTRLDAVSLSRLEISTWRTDAGDRRGPDVHILGLSVSLCVMRSGMQPRPRTIRRSLSV